MNTLKALLDNKQVLKPNQSKRPINMNFEQAFEFGKYVGLSTFFVMRLFKTYGKKEVLSIRSWLYDCPFDPKRGGKIALSHWKLKEMIKNKTVG